MEEILSRMLKKQMELGKIASFYHHRGAPIISHLLYSDDIIIFMNDGTASLRAVSNVLKKYEPWTDQVVNKRKSSI